MHVDLDSIGTEMHIPVISYIYIVYICNNITLLYTHVHPCTIQLLFCPFAKHIALRLVVISIDNRLWLIFTIFFRHAKMHGRHSAKHLPFHRYRCQTDGMNLKPFHPFRIKWIAGLFAEECF